VGKTQHLAVRTAVSTSTDPNATAAQWLPCVASRDARSAELPRTSGGLVFGMCSPGGVGVIGGNMARAGDLRGIWQNVPVRVDKSSHVSQH